METSDWHKERDRLRSRFAKGDITSATRKELEWYLVVIANSHSNPGGYPVQQETHRRETEAFTTLIRHLLVVKVAEELHKKSHTIAIWALAVSVAAAVFAGLLWYAEDRKHDVKIAPPAPPVSISNQTPGASSTLTESKLPLPAPQSSRYIAATNSTTNASPASTNR